MFEDMAQRIVNAENSFIDDVVEQFGTTVAEAEKVLTVFLKHKLVKIDPVGGQCHLKTGAAWEAKVIANAIAE